MLTAQHPHSNAVLMHCRYVPGAVLEAGVNEVIFLEVESAPEDATGAYPH